MNPACLDLPEGKKNLFLHRRGFESAKKICAECPEVQKCLDRELPHEEEVGYRWHVFGGTTPDERDAVFGKLR